MSDPKPLTVDEVRDWPALGPLTLDPRRVLALFEALERAEKERDEARTAQAASWNETQALIRAIRSEGGKVTAGAFEWEVSFPSLRSVAERQREACEEVVAVYSSDSDLLKKVRATPLVTDGGEK
jgi:hypothetical protein